MKTKRTKRTKRIKRTAKNPLIVGYYNPRGGGGYITFDGDTILYDSCGFFGGEGREFWTDLTEGYVEGVSQAVPETVRYDVREAKEWPPTGCRLGADR